METTMEDLMSLKQEASVSDYCEAFETLLGKISLEDLSEDCVVYYFITGLKPEISEVLKPLHNIDRSLKLKVAIFRAKMQEINLILDSINRKQVQTTRLGRFKTHDSPQFTEVETEFQVIDETPERGGDEILVQVSVKSEIGTFISETHEGMIEVQESFDSDALKENEKDNMSDQIVVDDVEILKSHDELVIDVNGSFVEEVTWNSQEAQVWLQVNPIMEKMGVEITNFLVPVQTTDGKVRNELVSKIYYDVLEPYLQFIFFVLRNEGGLKMKVYILSNWKYRGLVLKYLWHKWKYKRILFIMIMEFADNGCNIHLILTLCENDGNILTPHFSGKNQAGHNYVVQMVNLQRCIAQATKEWVFGLLEHVSSLKVSSQTRDAIAIQCKYQLEIDTISEFICYLGYLTWPLVVEYWYVKNHIWSKLLMMSDWYFSAIASTGTGTGRAFSAGKIRMVNKEFIQEVRVLLSNLQKMKRLLGKLLTLISNVTLCGMDIKSTESQGYFDIARYMHMYIMVWSEDKDWIVYIPSTYKVCFAGYSLNNLIADTPNVFMEHLALKVVKYISKLDMRKRGEKSETRFGGCSQVREKWQLSIALIALEVFQWKPGIIISLKGYESAFDRRLDSVDKFEWEPGIILSSKDYDRAFQQVKVLVKYELSGKRCCKRTLLEHKKSV